MATPTHDPAGSAYLSGLSFESGELDELALLAETLLGLHGVTFSGGHADVACTAVAVQVRFLKEGGIDPSLYSEYTLGKRRMTFNVKAQAGISGLAQNLADTALGTKKDTFKVLTSLR